MKAQIRTYYLDTLKIVQNIEIPDNYDGDAYGDTIPFSVGSNQEIVTDEDLFLPEMDLT
jgi:hypothetical protein